MSSRSYDAIGADIKAERSIYDANDLPVFSGWSPAIQETKQSQHCEEKAQLIPEKRSALSNDAAAYMVEQCTITHPGSITCTQAAVNHDDGLDSVVLSLKATVRKTERSVCSNMLDLEELGWIALKHTASQRAASIKQLAMVPGEHDERHQQVVHLLKNGVVIDAVRNENSFGHVSYVVTLEDQKLKQRCKALFKPSMEGDGDGWHRVPIEAAAYQLNLLLGMDYVPPAVFRSSVDVDWQNYEKGGVFIYYCSSAQDLKNVPMNDWGCKPDVLLSDTRILDVLIQNSDRHAGHFLWADHWAKGLYQGGRISHDAWRGRKYPLLIDQSAGFRNEAFVCLDHENAFGTGPTRAISAKTYMRLRFLDRSTATAALKEYISDDEITQLLSRKDSILSYFDKLVEQKGYKQVVLEDSCDLPQRA